MLERFLIYIYIYIVAFWFVFLCVFLLLILFKGWVVSCYVPFTSKCIMKYIKDMYTKRERLRRKRTGCRL